MESQYQHTVNGQSVLEADLNVVGETSALSDDRVFAELFRMQPYDGSTVRKGVCPHAHAASARDELVGPNGASGSVKVNPFRAFIGTRTAVATDAKKNWRDIRSAIAVGSTTLAQSVSISANSSGNPRWDLIYAAVAVDANGASVTRKVKDPTTKVITGQSVVTTKVTTVTLAVQAGTAAASPDWPAVPADSGSTYYVPLAYVRVPNGFGASSTVLDTDIGIIAPVLRLSHATGGRALSPANAMHKQAGAALTNAKIQTWGSSGTRPGFFLPSTLSGGEQILIAIDLTTGSESQASGSVVDDSRDWRGRLCRWTAVTGATGAVFAWQNIGVNPTIPASEGAATQEETLAAATRAVSYGVGHTCGKAISAGDAVAMFLSGSNVANMADGTTLSISCDATTGFLEVVWTGSPNCKVLIWLDFTGPIDNHDR